jgi:apolipoprotein N-acyltransferase
MMIAGGVTMLLHPFFYFIPLGAYMFAKKHLGEGVALVALPFLWVGYEYSHSLTEWSFPWLTIGNSQSYALAHIQFIGITGIYGVSFWILVMNVLAYLMYSLFAQGRIRPFSATGGALVGLLLLVYAAPAIHGSLVLTQAGGTGAVTPDSGRHTITVGMVQPNLDPWEKWTQSGYRTIDTYLNATKELVADPPGGRKPDLVLWPETAMPFALLIDENRQLLEGLRAQLGQIGTPVLTGLPQIIYYADQSKAPPSAKRDARTGRAYDVYNAAALIQPGVEETPWYGKMKLVPIAERVPYADVFYFIDFLRWDVGIGGWQIGRDTTVFVERKTGARFCAMICYESTYPGFVAAFVRKGAEFITIITIDSWWGKMSGAYQHERFAIFRAIENRRWIARCALGGISCYIDPYGRVYDSTEMFTRANLARTIGRSNELTFYTKHGDWFGEGCLWCAFVVFAGSVGQAFMNKKRKLQWATES